MTGTGVQADPYIIMSWNDFKAVLAQQSSAQKYAEFGADIDMNEVAPGGISVLTMSKTNIDGKNHALKNLVANSGFLSITSSNIISNLKILNFINRGTSNFISCANNANIRFKNCVVSGINASTAKMISTTGTRYSSYVEFSATDDGGSFVNIDISSGGFASGIVYATDSYIRLSGEKNSESLVWQLNNSYINGVFFGSNFYNCYNSVIDAECVDSNFAVVDCSNLLVNTDKFTGTFSTEEGVIKVTAEQMKNAEYLRNSGFPIGVE